MGRSPITSCLLPGHCFLSQLPQLATVLAQPSVYGLGHSIRSLRPRAETHLNLYFDLSRRQGACRACKYRPEQSKITIRTARVAAMNGVPAEDNAMDQTGVSAQVAMLLLAQSWLLLNTFATHSHHYILHPLGILGRSCRSRPPKSCDQAHFCPAAYRNRKQQQTTTSIRMLILVGPS